MAKCLTANGLNHLLEKFKASLDKLNYAGSTSPGGSANSVANSLTIQLNSGTATTFNGSSAKSINITPSSIGAANVMYGTTTPSGTAPIGTIYIKYTN